MVDSDKGPLNNMDVVCRLCLSEDGNTVPIFQDNHKHAVPLPIQIMSCAQIQVRGASTLANSLYSMCE